ncbi:hypothetical protein DDZ18_07260 [Marinicauda salina]|uniref:Fe2OG dioxygenase domain-containing protein n=2 Tax=Marinicauda salina TaxID=2135793 RepID=A0A2U2BTX4_9PROT|nr:hypothetical protein DDZ18_07260 [Marinicauda salina]
MTQTEPGPRLDAAIAAWRAGRLDETLETLDSLVREGVEPAGQLLLQAAAEDAAPTGSRARAADALAAAPDAPAFRRHRAYLRASGYAGAPDLAGAIADRLEEARAGDAQAGLEIALLALMIGETDAADALLEAAAEAGSGHAVAALLRRGAETGSLSETAASRAPALQQTGHPLAAALAAAANGLPTRPKGAADAADTLAPDALTSAFEAADAPSETLAEKPAVMRWPQAFPAALCDYLAAGAAPLLAEAVIFDPTTGETRPDPHRKALSAALSDGVMDLALFAFKARMAALAALPVEQGEYLAVLAYRPGDAYRAHCDYITDDGGAGTADLARGGQRIATTLVKLNEEYEGGETVFPRLDVAWTGGRGDALTFMNADADGAPDPMSLHAGEPVRAGMKVLASLWMRERPTR